MRVAMDYSNDTTYTVEDSCATHDFGEVEDYTVNIIDPTLNNPNFELSGVTIYPNPFNTELVVRVPSDFIGTQFQIQLYDLRGREIRNISETFSTQEMTITSISNLASGSYFLKVSNSNSSITKKLIKN